MGYFYLFTVKYPVKNRGTPDVASPVLSGVGPLVEKFISVY